MSTATPPSPIIANRLRPGDRIAVISPSQGLPGALPLPFELGLKRLREDFDLEPVEYPTTRKMGSSAQERAADIHAAFADPDIAGVIASIGGDDQITVLPHLVGELLQANPKQFYGFSDCTNLLVYLERLGIVGYHGATVMTAFGRPGAMHPMTEESLRAAMFTGGAFALTAAEEVNDRDRDWGDESTFDEPPSMFVSGGWQWHNANPEQRQSPLIEGRSWGGNLEIVSWLAMANRYLPEPEELSGRVLFFETSEELPDDKTVYRTLRNLGERGFLQQCAALIMGRPKTWSFVRTLSHTQSNKYRAAQHKAVLAAMGEYAPHAPVVLDVDLGHTDPQLVIPYGGTIRLDLERKTITVEY
ncbi:S66 family peptidase [Natronoglycomyces albus]|uniref:LD-carboxypeptidase n=1 Tax=Natronoglycomyces albus TaxID=2811108 RepID=A0A895XQC4_9ACTN|nr:S66 peptidase family protein [Natronoglycomyces albus]QSB04756.1 LD-carboxypeptidase [Natronoglycomyces albus]